MKKVVAIRIEPLNLFFAGLGIVPLIMSIFSNDFVWATFFFLNVINFAAGPFMMAKDFKRLIAANTIPMWLWILLYVMGAEPSQLWPSPLVFILVVLGETLFISLSFRELIYLTLNSDSPPDHKESEEL